MADKDYEFMESPNENILGWGKSRGEDFYKIISLDSKWKRRSLHPKASDALRKFNRKNAKGLKYEDVKKSLINSTLQRKGILSNTEARRKRSRKRANNLSLQIPDYHSLLKRSNAGQITDPLVLSVVNSKEVSPKESQTTNSKT